MSEQYELTIDNQETPAFTIKNSCAVLAHGNTGISVLRSVSKSPFFPMTDNQGDELVFPSGSPSNVIFNSCIENSHRACEFKIALDPTLVSANTSVTVTLSQGW